MITNFRMKLITETKSRLICSQTLDRFHCRPAMLYKQLKSVWVIVSLLETLETFKALKMHRFCRITCLCVSVEQLKMLSLSLLTIQHHLQRRLTKCVIMTLKVAVNQHRQTQTISNAPLILSWRPWPLKLYLANTLEHHQRHQVRLRPLRCSRQMQITAHSNLWCQEPVIIKPLMITSALQDIQP